jgi:hypothetical protein
MDPLETTGQGELAQPDEFASLDLSGFEPNETVEGTAPDTGQGNNDGSNPLYADLLKEIPSAFHPLVTKQLSEWDRQAQERFQQRAQQEEQAWSGFKQFRDQKVDPAYLASAYGLAQALQQDPVGIYANLHQRLTSDPNFRQALQERGLLQQAVQEAQQQQSPDAFAEDDVAKQVEALKQQIQQRDEQLVQFFQQKEHEEREQQYFEEETQRIDNDFASLEQKIGRPLPREVKAQIAQTAAMLGQTAGRYVSVIEAAPQVFRLIQAAQAGQRIPPSFIPTSGGALPQPQQKDPGEMTFDERVAYLTQLSQNNS